MGFLNWLTTMTGFWKHLTWSIIVHSGYRCGSRHGSAAAKLEYESASVRVDLNAGDPGTADRMWCQYSDRFM